jgi:hypothetical protein
MTELGCAVLGGGGTAVQDSAVLGPGGMTDLGCAVLGGGGTTDLGCAVLGGGGTTDLGCTAFAPDLIHLMLHRARPFRNHRDRKNSPRARPAQPERNGAPAGALR